MSTTESFSDLDRYSNTNTITYEEDGTVLNRIVVLYDTQIVNVDFGDGYLNLNHGGYKTRTTKKRMNEALSSLDLTYGVIQRDGTWYLIDRRDHEKVAEFEDESLTTRL